jgi:hypothetical protein
MTQHSITKGLKLFGDAGVNAIMNELHLFMIVECSNPKLLPNCPQNSARTHYSISCFLNRKEKEQLKEQGAPMDANNEQLLPKRRLVH